MTIYYDEEVIKKFKQGAVVKVVKACGSKYQNMIGHVQGFGLNSTMEVTVIVLLCNQDKQSFHVSNLEVI